ncbi:RsmE family RNA methyltransferase, partial [Candidatus Eisenbacteria bacterium]
LRRVALAAMKQSGRARWPEVSVHASLETLLVEAGCSRVVVADMDGEMLMPAVRSTSPEEEHLLLVGPEGGFSPNEEAQLSGLDCMRVRLAPRRLRSETAAVALCAILAAALDQTEGVVP